MFFAILLLFWDLSVMLYKWKQLQSTIGLAQLLIKNYKLNVLAEMNCYKLKIKYRCIFWIIMLLIIPIECCIIELWIYFCYYYFFHNVLICELKLSEFWGEKQWFSMQKWLLFGSYEVKSCALWDIVITSSFTHIS